MSVTMNKTDGITVFTVTTDSLSHCPPLCQILKGLCYSPVCCTVSRHLRTVQGTSQSVLGALHFMIGLLNIGLGAILCSGGDACWWRMGHTLFPFWFGGVFMLFACVSILSEKCPSPCLIILNVILNVAGIAFAIAAIVLYSLSITEIWLWWMCHDDYDRYYPYKRPTRSPREEIMMKKCLEGEALVLLLMESITVVLIVLSVLELCVAVSSAVLGIKALRSSEKKENKCNDEPERFNPLLEEVTSYPAP